MQHLADKYIMLLFYSWILCNSD